MTGSGCGGGSCGIQRVREAERERALDAVLRAHPELRWGAPETWPAETPDLEALGRAFEEALPARAFVLRAEPDGLADWLYLLAGVHRPSLWELREGLSERPAVRRSERYVRLGVSPLGPFATLQECELEWIELDGMVVIVERPVLGVTDVRLRRFVTCAQGIARRSGLLLLDVAFLIGAPPAELATDEAFRSRFATAPTLWSFLFDPGPPTTTREVVVHHG